MLINKKKRFHRGVKSGVLFLQSTYIILLVFCGVLVAIALLTSFLVPEWVIRRVRTGLRPEVVAPDLSQIVEDELKKLAPGRILFNPSKEMTVGVRERVEVRIARTITEDLTEGLKGHGEPQIEEIRVGTFMKAHLTGDNFNIKALSHEEQVVVGQGFTQWDFDVTPLKSGIQTLSLTVTVRIKIPNYGDEKKDCRVFDREIKVQVNPIYSIKYFIKSHWKWIVGIIISSGVFGLIVRKVKEAKKK